MFHYNEGTADRVLRVIIGAALYALAIAGIPAAPWLYVSLAIGTILVLTGLVGFCPLYAILRLSTKSARS
jgi:Inner membrane protein YgaP-like, transmembrane domain